MVRLSAPFLVFAVALTACGGRSALVADGGAGRGGAGVGGATGEGGATGVGGTTGAAGASVDAGFDEPEVATGPVPGAFSLTSPIADPLAQAAATFSWSASADAVSYEVELSTTPSFDAATTRRLPVVNGTKSFVDKELARGLVYYWRVSAVGPGGARTMASSSPAWFSVPIDATSPFGVAATSKGKVVFVEHLKPGLTIFDPATSAERFVQTTGFDARMLAVTRDGTRAFINEIGGRTVTQVDLENDRPAEVVLSTKDQWIYGFDVTPDGATLVAPVMDTTLNETVLASFPVVGTAPPKTIRLGVQQVPYNAILTPDGETALVAVGGLSHIHLASGLSAKIPQAGGYALAVTADGRKAWMTEGEEGGVREIDLVTNTRGRVIPFMPAHDFCGLAISPDGKHGVATSSRRVGVLDLQAGTVIKTFDLWARCAAISPDGRRAYVSTLPGSNAGKVVVLPLPLP
jgi:hypothetical protein